MKPGTIVLANNSPLSMVTLQPNQPVQIGIPNSTFLGGTAGMAPGQVDLHGPEISGLNIADAQLDVVISNTGGSAAYLAFTPFSSEPIGSHLINQPTTPVGPQAPGSVVVPPNSSILITARAEILQFTQGNPLIIGGAQALLAQTAVAASAMSPSGSTLTIARGEAKLQWSWPLL